MGGLRGGPLALVGRQRLGDRAAPQLLDRVALPFRPLGELGEVEAVPLRAEALLKRAPEAGLAGDADRQALQLDQPAERRVTAQLPVELQTTELLHDPGRRRLEPARLDVEALHHAPQRLAVGLDLLAEVRQRLAEL